MSGLVVIVPLNGPNSGWCSRVFSGPPGLWPVLGRPAADRVIGQLAGQGVEDVVVMGCQGDEYLLARKEGPCRVEFLKADPARGRAGYLFDAIGNSRSEVFAKLPGYMVCVPDVGALLKAHEEGKADLSVVVDSPCSGLQEQVSMFGVYVGHASLLDHIPEEGYQDVKENLIPQLIRSGRVVKPILLASDMGHFEDWNEYLKAVSRHLEAIASGDAEFRLIRQESSVSDQPSAVPIADAPRLWVRGEPVIDPSCRIIGPVAILDGARIGRNVLIVGPTVIERGVDVGDDAVIINSVVWDRARIGAWCSVERCVVRHDTTIPSGTAVEGQAVGDKDLKQQASGRELSVVGRQRSGFSDEPRMWLFAAIASVSVAFIWSHWEGLMDLRSIWQRSDEYSSGLLVPFLACYALWSSRDRLRGVPVQPCLWGMVVLVMSMGLRLFGAYFMYGSAERLSIVVAIWGLALCLGGIRILKQTWGVLLFLFLMLPWPNRVQAAISLPLQEWSTSSAVFGLELFGFGVIREGNVIHIGSTSVAVAEACNGLRMITAFFVINGLVILLIHRRWWEKLVILASSLPIALACNTIRLTLTSIVFTRVSGEYWERLFHDFGGYAMMPLALGFVVLELGVLRLLFVPPETGRKVIVRRGADEPPVGQGEGRTVGR